MKSEPPVAGLIYGSGRGSPNSVMTSKQDMNVQNRSKPPFLGSRRAVRYEHVGAGIVEIDGEGRILSVNQHARELMGYPAAELLGRSIFEKMHPEDVDRDRGQFRRQLAGEIDRYIIEQRICKKGGAVLWVEVTSSCVRDVKGKFLYAVRVQHDTTARKQAEFALARRMEEQAALFQFSECLQHVESLKEICEVALEAITRALDCDRASILINDRADVMRFVAWRGLSAEYRKAVEGHSPWARDEKRPQPVLIQDVAVSDLPTGLKQVIASEKIGAAIFVPILQSGRLVGKFTAYYDRPSRLSGPQIDVALTIARQLSFSVARLKADEARYTAERSAVQLVAIVESSDDAIISKDLNGVIQTWNAAAERLFGYSAEEAIGRPVTIVFPPGKENEEPGILSGIMRGERIDHYETMRRHKDGSLLDISLTVSPMRDSSGAIIGASKIARDITERKDAQRKLEQSERHLQDLLAAIPAAIYTTDAQGRITYFNQAAAELAGRTPTIGSDEWCVTWKLFNPDGTPLPHDQCPMAVALREGRTIRNAEAIAERPDGTRVPFIPYPTPLRDASGRIVGAINMLADISERRQAETQQRSLLDELNHRTKNNMQMLLSLLKSATRSAASEETKRVLGEACSRIAAMAAAQRVLYGRADTNRFDGGEFLGAVCQTMRQALPAEVKITCKDATGVLPNDAAMPLALIVNELVTNALKHGIKDRSKDEVRVSLTESDGELLLSIEDDGEGFDLNAVRRTSSGLQLVSGLARQLQGSFEVTRNPSRARLRFPASRT
jgi:PAS domain S-box-containing protein